MHPLAKLGAVMCFILTVLSFDKYALSGVVAMGIYPVFLYQLADLSLCEGIKRFRTVAFLLIGLGLAYVYFDTAVLLNIGGRAVSGGWVALVVWLL